MQLLADIKHSVKTNWDKQDIRISVWCAFTFIGLGTNLYIISPTILDFASYIGVDVAELATVLLLRSIGSVIGSVTSGIIFDRFAKCTLWFISTFIILGALATCIVPFGTHIAVLCVLFMCQGFTLGGLETGVQVFVIGIWKNKDPGPIIQFINFVFAVGAFLAPLIARPFILASSPPNTNITCTQLFIINSTDKDIYSDECYRQKVDNCSWYLNEGSGGSAFMELLLVVDDCLVSFYSSTFRYAFLVAAVLTMTTLPGILYYAIKTQCCCKYSKSGDEKDMEEEETTEKTELEMKELPMNKMTEEKLKSEDSNDKTNSYPDITVYKVVLLVLSALLVYLYFGTEVSYGTYLFAYSVEGDLKFSKRKATILSSVFWGNYALVRFISIFLALFKVRPSILLTANFTGALIASLTLVFGADNEIATWVGSALMGISLASIYPNILNWFVRNGPVNGKTTALLIALADGSEMSLPILVGILMDRVTPISLCYFTLTTITLCHGVLIVLLVIVCSGKKEEDKEKEYQQLK